MSPPLPLPPHISPLPCLGLSRIISSIITRTIYIAPLSASPCITSVSYIVISPTPLSPSCYTRASVVRDIPPSP